MTTVVDLTRPLLSFRLSWGRLAPNSLNGPRLPGPGLGATLWSRNAHRQTETTRPVRSHQMRIPRPQLAGRPSKSISLATVWQQSHRPMDPRHLESHAKSTNWTPEYAATRDCTVQVRVDASPWTFESSHPHSQKWVELTRVENCPLPLRNDRESVRLPVADAPRVPTGFNHADRARDRAPALRLLEPHTCRRRRTRPRL
jgi:hypothetical protein